MCSTIGGYCPSQLRTSPYDLAKTRQLVLVRCKGWPHTAECLQFTHREQNFYPIAFGCTNMGRNFAWLNYIFGKISLLLAETWKESPNLNVSLLISRMSWNTREHCWHCGSCDPVMFPFAPGLVCTISILSSAWHSARYANSRRWTGAPRCSFSIFSWYSAHKLF